MRTDGDLGKPSDQRRARYTGDKRQLCASSANRTRHDNPEGGRLESEVYDVARWSASARVVMDDARRGAPAPPLIHISEPTRSY